MRCVCADLEYQKKCVSANILLNDYVSELCGANYILCNMSLLHQTYSICFPKCFHFLTKDCYTIKVNV